MFDPRLSDPVTLWWSLLVAVSALNIAAFAILHRNVQRHTRGLASARVKVMILLCAAYVFGCAFRSILPRADVQRICLFDTWLSSVAVGRSVATVAEICFVIQWAIVLRELSSVTQSHFGRNVAYTIVPLIVVAEICSWYAVITTSYLGNTIENSLWAVAFFLIGAALMRMLADFNGLPRALMAGVVAGIGGYIAFLIVVDVPMYFTRWQADLATAKPLLGLFEGWHDVRTRWVVTYDFGAWKSEMMWMALYFSAAVWSSLAMAGLVATWEGFRRVPAARIAGPRAAGVEH